jgi:dipeptidase E
MNVIVLSLGLGYLPEVLKEGSKVLFIPNAGDTYEDPYFVKNDFERLAKMGYEVTELDLLNTSQTAESLLASDADAIFAAGGNTFYLLSLLKQTGFDEAIKNWIKHDRLYIGASAGGVVLGPSLEPIVDIDDPSKALTLSYDSLAVTDIVVLPHYGKEKYKARYHTIWDNFSSKFTLEYLKDDEALIFSGPKDFRKVGSALIFHE